MKSLLTLILIGFTALAVCQSKPLLNNSKPIEENKYKDIKGSPYFFESWIPATIYFSDGESMKVDQLNINGFRKEIEIRNNDHYIVLDQLAFNRIEIELENQPKQIFLSNKRFEFRSSFVELIFEGKKIVCVRQFIVKMEEVELQNVGKTEKIKRFKPEFIYYFIKGDKVEEVVIKEKQLLNFLGFEKQMITVLNKRKLKADPVNHLKEILTYFESL